MMCFVMTIVGIDEEDGPQVFKVDPSGFHMGYSAISAGAKEQEGINHLERLHRKNKEGYSTEKAIQTAISSICTVIGTDFKATELEVGVATVDKPHFVRLTTEEIDHHMNVLSDEA
jgi:20S proteasome subunit alpha 1